ncbi:hypothetical protein [Phenylobacterium sp.]|uniref:hypothetical protein n=1 Tax=Phenylobacterium sp. TaxID=1871053 RepID=UPI002CB839A3|nr:hypothetical protein [Phenylobacterium sp.]HVI31012.1 hypothetical protein [Phenylobacterium sp.]
MSKLDPDHLYDEGLQVTTEGAAVVILGPDSVAIALTPAAARRSSARLLDAAATAERAGGPPAPTLPIQQE